MTTYDPEDDPQTFGAAEPDSIHDDPDMRKDEDHDPAASSNPDPEDGNITGLEPGPDRRSSGRTRARTPACSTSRSLVSASMA